MGSRPLTDTFEEHRPHMLALAYRMLGDVARAEDIVQDAWLRVQNSETEIHSPRGFLTKAVTRLCLNELTSARARKEEARGDRLPEPVDLENSDLGRVESLDRISMAFLVVLQRLAPAERAVLLLHEVFGFQHAEIGAFVEKTPAACRQLLKRAREHVQDQRRSLSVAEDVHQRLLREFLVATRSGDVDPLVRLLTDDAVMIADGGPEGATYGRVRNLPGPITGAKKVAAFLAAVSSQGADGLVVRECQLNGQPGILVLRAGAPYATISIAVRDARISAVFLQADPNRLGHVGAD